MSGEEELRRLERALEESPRDARAAFHLRAARVRRGLCPMCGTPNGERGELVCNPCLERVHEMIYKLMGTPGFQEAMRQRREEPTP